MRLGFFFREALRALRRNAAPSFAALATVLVTVLLLGVFIPVVQATTGAANDVRGRVIANVFMQRDATDRDIARVRTLLENDTPHVARIEYISKEEAYAREKERNPEAYQRARHREPADGHIPDHARRPGQHQQDPQRAHARRRRAGSAR